MEVRQLAYVVAVAETLNFTRAAQRCAVVQSALSQQISKLERELGTQLFTRSSRAVALTTAGELFVPHARRILASIESSRAAMADHLGVVTGVLRLGMYGAALRVPGVEASLAAFHRAHRFVELRISDPGSVNMIGRVAAGDLELAFVGVYSDAVPDPLRALGLSDEPLVAIVQPGSSLTARPSVTLAELAAAGPTVDLPEHNGLRQAIDHAFELSGVERRVVAEFPALDDVVRFATLGLGSTLVRAPYVHRIDGEVDFRVVPIRDPHARTAISLVAPRAESMSPSARAYLDVLLRLLASNGYTAAAESPWGFV